MTRDVSSDRKDFGESLFGGRDSRGSCRRAPRIFRARLFSLPLKSIEEDVRGRKRAKRVIFSSVGSIYRWEFQRATSGGIVVIRERREGGVPFSGEFLGW